MTQKTHNEKVEAERSHLHALVERLVRDGYSEREIAREVARAAAPQRRAA